MISIDKRSGWTFQYYAHQVAEGAKKQLEFRRDRERWWADKKAEVMARIRESGIEINESLADQNYTMSTQSRGYGPQIAIDTNLQRQLAEAHGKIATHHDAAEEYDGWVQVLSAAGNREKVLELTQEDWLYFFGKL